ncbi:MAG: hypothetical protein ACLPSH_21635 [Vulcanimicrobiaceae bacterium]
MTTSDVYEVLLRMTAANDAAAAKLMQRFDALEARLERLDRRMERAEIRSEKMDASDARLRRLRRGADGRLGD